jgi:hypothetical protein
MSGKFRIACVCTRAGFHIHGGGGRAPVGGGFGVDLGTGGGCPGGAEVGPRIVLTFVLLLLQKNAESFSNTKWQKGPPGVDITTSVCARACVHTDIIPTPHITQDFLSLHYGKSTSKHIQEGEGEA